jgi:hypothetical protein
MRVRKAEPQIHVPAARFASRSCHRSLRRTEGAGKTGCWLHPQPRVQQRKHTSSHYRFNRDTRPSLRDGVNAYVRALPGVRDLIVTVTSGSRRVGPEGPTSPIRSLSASPGAPGPHDFAVRDRFARQTIRPRPSHPASNTRDDREAPLSQRRDGITIIIIFGKTEAKYFLQRGWTRIRKPHLSGKSLATTRCSQRAFARTYRLTSHRIRLSTTLMMSDVMSGK